MPSPASIDLHEFDSVAPLIAKWLAPHLKREFDLEPQPASASHASEYDPSLCRLFAGELGDTVVLRAHLFFGALAGRGELTSLELSELLGLSNQRSIGANLTVSLSKRIKALDLDEPWEIDSTPDGERTIWRDRDGIAARMHTALAAEISRRGLGSGGATIR